MYKGLLVFGVFVVGIALGYGIRGTDIDSVATSSIIAEEEAKTATYDAPAVKTRGLAPMGEALSPKQLRGGDITIVQQRTGTICQTSVGTCVVPPQDINSPCRCGNSVGQVVR